LDASKPHSMASSDATPLKGNKDALSKRIRELQLEKFADAEVVQKRLQTFISTHSAAFSEDDVNFVTLFVESFAPHKQEISQLTTALAASKKKHKVLGNYCRTLEEQKKKLLTWKEQMKEQIDNSLTDVKSRIALYVEENELLVNDNRKLRDALGKALEFDTKRAAHLKVLQETTDFYRANHEDMDSKYTQIIEELSKDSEKAKTRLRESVTENMTIKETNMLLYKKLAQNDDAKQLYDEFDKKYKVIIEENSKCIGQYKTLNDKLKKQNDSLRKQNSQTRLKSQKTNVESKALKKTNHKLDKKVSTLGNLCRDLQTRLKEAQARAAAESEHTSEETTI